MEDPDIVTHLAVILVGLEEELVIQYHLIVLILHGHF